MVKNWLLSEDHFCISESGDSSGNDDVCWHGLPSIARSDPAYPANGYWRGLVWVRLFPTPRMDRTFWQRES